MGEDVPRDVRKGGFWWWSRGPRRVHRLRARRYDSRADWEGFRWGGVGLSPHLPCVGEEFELVCRNLTGVVEGMGKNLIVFFDADKLVYVPFV